MKKEPFCIEKRYDMIDAKEMMKQPGVDDAITKVLVKMKMNPTPSHSALDKMLLKVLGPDSMLPDLYAAGDIGSQELASDALATVAAICVLCMVKVGQE